MECVKNLYCDALADDGQFTLLYSIKPGVCKKSFGIEVAQLAGFPERVLARAKEYLKVVIDRLTALPFNGHIGKAVT